jgi:hypothetical protein
VQRHIFLFRIFVLHPKIGVSTARLAPPYANNQPQLSFLFDDVPAIFLFVVHFSFLFPSLHQSIIIPLSIHHIPHLYRSTHEQRA